MEKESVKKFDLEAAFKALDEIEIPQTKGIKANRVDLKERFGHKPATETLVEDYYDVSSNEDLKDAKEERDGEIAKAKLARIEKIVDLNAESPDDLLPSYVGKVIMQCPQCMTLFYKNPEDIEPSEENPDIVNLNEPCQHCGNTSGYTLIGKVGAVTEDEADKYEEAPTEENENELNLDFGKGTEEVDAEGTGKGAEEMSGEETKEESSDEASSDEDLDLDLNLDEVPEEEPEEEKKEESLKESKATKQRLTVVEPGYQYKDKDGNIYTLYGDECEEDDTGIVYDWEFVDDENGDIYIIEEMAEESLSLSKEATENESEHKSENLTLNEEIDKDLDEKLKAHNDYIAYLQQMIKQEEEALKKAENDEIKAAIQRRLDAFNADLEAALPDAVKAEVSAEDIAEEPVEEEPKTEEEKVEDPGEETAEEKAEEEALVDEALTEETKECKVVLADKPEKEVFAGTKEECEKIIEKNKETKTAKEHGLKIVEPAANENKTEEKSALKESVESEIDSIIASWDVNESLNLQPSIADRFTKSQLAELTPEEIKILQEPLKNRAEVDKIIAKYNPKNKFNEGIKFKTTDKLCSVVLNGRQCFAGTKEECEKFIKDHKSEQAARDMGGFKLLNTAEVAINEGIKESAIKNNDESMPLRSVEIKDKENSKKGIGWLVIYGEKDSLHKEFKNEEEAKKFAKENNGKLMPFRTTEVESLNEDLEDLEANATIVDYVEYKHSYCHALEPKLKKINYYANVLKKPVNYIKAMVKGIIKNSPEVRWTDKEQWFMDKLNEFWPDSYELYKFIKNSIKKAHDTWVYVDADGELIPELNKDMISLPVKESLKEYWWEDNDPMNWSDKEPLVYSCYYNSELLGYLEYPYMGREEYPTTIRADIIKHFELPKDYNPKEISWRYIENDPLDETKPLVKINESLKAKTTDKLCSVVLNGRQCFVGTKEECEKFIKDHKSEEAAKEIGGFKLLNTAEIYVNESLTEEGDLDRLLDSDEFKTPVSEEEINAARREVAKESLEEKCGKQKITEESDSEIAAIINSWEDTPEVSVEESCEGPECESKEECDDCLKEEKEDESEVEETNSSETSEEVCFTAEEVKEVATDVAQSLATPVEDEEEAEKQAEEISEVVDEKVDKAIEEKAEETDEDKAEEDETEEDESDEEEPEEEIEEPEFNEDDIDELDEDSLNKHIDEYLKEVYSNVKSYETTDCSLKDGKLIVEGKISFNSGKEKLTMFEFLPAYCEGSLFFEGYNKDFSEDKAFTLNCSINEAKTLITESFGYKYKINENLVEGLK